MHVSLNGSMHVPVQTAKLINKPMKEASPKYVLQHVLLDLVNTRIQSAHT